MTKCYSKCRKVPEYLCTHEECKYVNGAKYKYCRLSHKYKMDENCISQPKPEPVKERTRKKRISSMPRIRENNESEKMLLQRLVNSCEM